MAVKDTGCGRGEVGVLMAVPDAGCEAERQGSHGSHRHWLVGEAGGSHGSLRHWLWWGGRRGFSWQFQTLVVEGADVFVLMAVPDAGCGWEAVFLLVVTDAGCGGKRQGFSCHSQTLVVGEGDVLVLMAVPDTGCGGERRVFSW